MKIILFDRVKQICQKFSSDGQFLNQKFFLKINILFLINKITFLNFKYF